MMARKALAVRSSARKSNLILLAMLGGAFACSKQKAPDEVAQQGPSPAMTPMAGRSNGGAIANETEDGQWVRPAKNYASTRFSGLGQITADNVKNLGLAWTFSLGVLRGQEAAPLVVNNTMYVVTPFPNILYALDLTKPGAPMKWEYRPGPIAAAQGVACCDVVNRGPSYADGKIVYNTLDDQTVAVDANSGKELWRTKVGEINLGESMTMAPLIVKNKVIVGNSGGEFGIRGWLTALDLGSGKIAWRAYHTGPDSAVLIGSRFKPFYAADRKPDLGKNTWPGDTWKIGGAGVWGWISYDPELNLIYYGTANPGPWNPEQRPGDNKWSSTIFARDPETGEAVWAYQMSPHDMHDYDGVNENILLDLPLNGKTRKVLVHPDRNGYIYTIDRTTGEVISADPFGYINTSTGVDLSTGRIKYTEEKEPQMGKVIRNACPASPGAKDWQPSAFSPATGLLYIPHQNLCQDVESVEANYIAGTPFVGMNVKMTPGPGGNRGFFDAWDPVARKLVWRINEKFPVWSGALATAGNVVFYGTMDGWFKAVDARSGKLLWQFKTGSGIIGQPVSYRGPDGKQYVAILSGVGGWSGAIVAGGIDPRDSSAALGFVNAMTDLPGATTKGGMLYVFALP
ncbi:MAG TPA: methanol/ethanol family PQQ-dependent dehydrogenase [Gemmatimonadaceae bacterium]|nr:methanol/ethanol family PQQ-dependent dehydrogenase [Gemmatimonadaceae bacterium]